MILIGDKLAIDPEKVAWMRWKWGTPSVDLEIGLVCGESFIVPHDSVHAWCGRVDARAVWKTVLEIRGPTARIKRTP